MRTRRDIEDRVFQLAANTVRWARHFRGTYIDRDLVRQFTRAVTSIGAHLEEARAAETGADFIHKVSVARKEAFEAHYWARLLLIDLEDSALQALLDEVNEVAAIANATDSLEGSVGQARRLRTGAERLLRQGVRQCSASRVASVGCFDPRIESDGSADDS